MTPARQHNAHKPIGMPLFAKDSPFTSPSDKRTALEEAKKKALRSERAYAQDRHVLRFTMRKAEGVEDTLMRCLPSFWSTLRARFDGGTADAFRPLSYRRDGQTVVVLASGPDPVMGRLRNESFVDVARQAYDDEMRGFEDVIPQAVLNAVHQATWPDGPAAIDAILAELEKMSQDTGSARKVKSTAVTTISLQKGVASGEKHEKRRIVLVVPRDGTLKGNRQRFSATRAAAKVIREGLTSGTVHAGIELLGVRDSDDGVHVAVSCGEADARTIRQSGTHGLKVLALKDPTAVDANELSSLRNVFEGVLASGADAVPAVRSTFLRPSSYGRALVHGMTIHGFSVLIMIGLWLVGMVSIGSSTTFLAGMGVMNMGIIPVFRRWALPAAELTRTLASDAASRLGSSASAVLPTAKTTQDERRRRALDDAWAELTTLVGRHAAAVAEARTACERFAALASTHGVTQHAAETAATIERMVPQLAEDLGHIAVHADRAERDAAVLRVVDALKSITVTADTARNSLLQGPRDRLATTISFIEAKSASTPLAAITDDNKGTIR